MEMKEKFSEKGKHSLLESIFHNLFLKLDTVKEKRERKWGKICQKCFKKQQEKYLYCHICQFNSVTLIMSYVN